MANISSANGTFEFDKDFYKANKELIEKYFDKAVLGAEYGINFVESTQSPVFSFEASGRWSMQNSLPWVLTPVCLENKEVDETEQEQVDLFEELFKRLAESNTEIKFDYDDEESGCQFYVHDIATLAPNKDWQQDPSQDCFTITNYQSQDLGFNDKNLVTEGYEGGYDLDSERDIEYLKQDYLNDWYQQQSNEFKADNSLEDAIRALKDFVNSNPDYNGAICWWRLDEDCDDLMKEALKPIRKLQRN